jgi:hypothetical protein
VTTAAARRRWRAVVALLSLVGVSCSSSLQRESASTAPKQLVEAVGFSEDAVVDDGHRTAAAPQSADVATTAGGDRGGATAPSRGGGGGGSGGEATTADPRGVVPAGSSPGSGPGVTADRILLGIVTLDAAGIQRVNGVNIGDPRRQAEAVIAYLNAHGGIAGRRVEAVFAEIDATSDDWERDYQAICVGFTEDHKVFAVVNATIAFARTFLPCLAQHGTPFINSAGGNYDTVESRAVADHFYTPGSMDLTRLATVYVDGLRDGGFFTSAGPQDEVRVGVIRPAGEAFDRAHRDVLLPRLAAAGSTPVAEAVVDAHRSLSHTASQMPNIVLRFQQERVNRLLIIDNGTLAVSFSLQASVQGYRPRYGLNSLNNPVLMQQNVPADVLVGSLGVGWQPTGDVDAQRDPGLSPATATCERIMADAGESNVSRTGQWSQRMYCDAMFFLTRALEGQAVVTAGALRTRTEHLGRMFDSAMTFGTFFGPGRHDGTAETRLFAYDQQCSCFQYVGEPRPTRDEGRTT